MDTTTGIKTHLFHILIEKTKIKCLLAFMLGALSALAMAPFNIWVVLFLTFTSLYLILKQCKAPIHAGLTGWSFGFGYFCFGLYWIGNALLVEGNNFIWAWPLAVAGLPALLSFFPAICLFFWKKLYKQELELSTFVGFVCAFALSEYLRSMLFTGFPWNLFGYTWGNTPVMAQLVSISDIYMLTFLTILWASSFALFFTSKINSYKKISFFLLIATTILTCALYGKNRIESYSLKTLPDKKIILIQPNIKQEEKWKPENLTPNFLQLINMTENQLQSADIKNDTEMFIIWPETALPLFFSEDIGVKNRIRQTLEIGPKNKTFLITGALTKGKNDGEFHNSLLVYNQKGEITNMYHKSHLVPFGEYMPLENVIDIAPIVGFKGFQSGGGPKTLEITDTFKISPLICYEIIFPNNVINRNETTPDVIINITNDGWYGHSTGPYQHLMQSRFRAIEEAIPVIRVANTGISAVITPLGEVVRAIELETEETISATIPAKKKTNIIHKNSGILLILIIGIFSYFLQITKRPNTSYN